MSVNENIEQFKVDFYEAVAGWLRFKISVGQQEFYGKFSHVYDSILDLKHWLEAVAVGVQQTSFEYCSEGYSTKFDFKRVSWNKEVSNVNDSPPRIFVSGDKDVFMVSDIDESEEIFINVTVDRRQLVKEFYLGLLTFAISDKFHSEEWEVEFMKERLCKFFSFDEETLIEKLTGLDGSDLGKLLFNANPTYIISFPTAKDKSEEIGLFVARTLNKELPKEHTMVKTPDEWEIPDDYNFWTNDKKREFVIECINETVSGFFGTKISDFRSSIIEKYLNKEESTKR